MQAFAGQQRRTLTAGFVILSKGHPLSSDQSKFTTTPHPDSKFLNSPLISEYQNIHFLHDASTSRERLVVERFVVTGDGRIV
jgi:hypothetical protein